MTGTAVFAQADDPAADLWSTYIDLCSPLVADPDTAFREIPDDLPLEILNWKQAEDASSVIAELASEDFSVFANVYLHRTEGGGSALLCEAEMEHATAGDPEVRLAEIQTMLTDMADLAVTAGMLADGPDGSGSEESDSEELPQAVLVVGNAFSPESALSMVYLSPYSTHVTVYHSSAP